MQAGQQDENVLESVQEENLLLEHLIETKTIQ